MKQSCLCEVCEEPEVRASTHMARKHIISFYTICGGEQVLPGQCGPVNSPPPPATLQQPPPSSSHRGRRISVSTLLPSLLGGFLGLLAIAYGVYRLVQWAKLQGFLGGVAPPPGPAGSQLQEQQLQQMRDAAASAAEERLERGAAAARVAV
ncbi:uncharacterized protein LOC125534002 [Triticum urartu]|uniref:uncharacterized protein LOC125533912 n=1 Tax=Triticum urartu TaxID=4572 RepID=UPI002044065F|nr:uncharacterized protein LOC125533912 [Triticum urartu]XP_048553268.1 uncharacterized protein LOC125534002 [Triticum urartu]